jgi:hypothetical protein
MSGYGNNVGIPHKWTDERDAAYRTPNSYGKMTAYGPRNEVFSSPEQTGLGGAPGNAYGVGFNLKQWFTDQGVTDPSQQTYYRYASLRGIPIGEEQYAYFGGASPSYFGAGAGENPYAYSGAGADNWKMNPQNMATDLKLAANGAQYSEADAAKLNNAQANRTSRIRLNAAGNTTEEVNPLANPALLARPTLLGGA